MTWQAMTLRQVLAGPRPMSVWAAVAAGAGAGLLWGVAARIWMRLIAPNPEFSLGGTAFIVLLPIGFGACVGLALVARQRGHVAWRRRLPQAACIVTFIPFGVGGGAPMMLNVLFVGLALNGGPVAVVWTIASLAVLVGTLGDGPMAAAITLPIVALVVTAWKCVHSRLSGNWYRVDWWVDRAVQTAAVLSAAGAFVVVWLEIIKAKPTLLAVAYMLYYVGLLVPLFIGLHIGVLRDQR